MIRPSLEQAKALSAGHTVVPIAMELFSDAKTSIEILKNIRVKYPDYYILESVENAGVWGRYTFIGYNPSKTISGRCGLVSVRDGGGIRVYPVDPLEIIEEVLGEYKSPRIPELPPFTGGLVGYFSYDFIKYTEPAINLKAKNTEGFDDFCLMLYDKVIAFDHFRQKICLIANVGTDSLEDNYVRAVADLKDMERMILSETAPEKPPSSLQSEFRPAFTREEYCGMVRKGKEHIVEGDIFQVVLSNRFTADFSGDLLSAYRVLRTTNPSPYMFYLSCGGLELAGASPETLISVKDGVAATYPLAGTCPRGKTAGESKKLEEELLRNEKELAEHDMLVDLGRNDLGKFCAFGSVRVEEYRQIKRFSHVCHISSRVAGDVRPDSSPLAAVAAVLPAGTLSGAPKIRACEIIDRLEGEKRGAYGGAVGYIDFAGNMDLCIGIRMAVLKDGKVHVQSGAGIVADSVPEREYEECMNKAGAVMDALQASKEV